MILPILTETDFERIQSIRRHSPERIQAAWRSRARRSAEHHGERMVIVAADHPARGSLGVRGDGIAMADRYDLLRRLAVALTIDGVDGVLGSPDILDDLLLLGLLEGKIAVGSMNRGGLDSSVFEFDDRFTGHTPTIAARDGLDFVKLLLRVGLEDPGTVRTLEAAAKVIDEASAAELPVMIEPFLSRRVDGRVVHDLSATGVVKSLSIASALGSSSAYTWLKLPVIDEMDVVMESTTLPTLLLGGDGSKSLPQLMTQWDSALRLPGVYGLVAGRMLLYPESDDVLRSVSDAVELVHGR